MCCLFQQPRIEKWTPPFRKAKFRCLEALTKPYRKSLFDTLSWSVEKCRASDSTVLPFRTLPDHTFQNPLRPRTTPLELCLRSFLLDKAGAARCAVPVVSSCGVQDVVSPPPPQSLPFPIYPIPVWLVPGTSRLHAALSEKARNTAVSSSPLEAPPTLPPGSRCEGTAVGVARGPVGKRAEPEDGE